MRRSLLFALILAFALPLLAVGSLLAPTNFSAVLSGGVISAIWDPVPDAVKYSVNIFAGYDTDADLEADVWLDYDFGTSDRTDGALMSDPYLDIPFADLVLEVDTDLDGVPDAFYDPISVEAKVKALAPGKGAGRQDNPFSDPVVVL
jgi:hypothetical protein